MPSNRERSPLHVPPKEFDVPLGTMQPQDEFEALEDIESLEDLEDYYASIEEDDESEDEGPGDGDDSWHGAGIG